MRWTWEAVLQISTFLGGLAAVVFFYDRYQLRKRTLSEAKGKFSRQPPKIFYPGKAVPQSVPPQKTGARKDDFKTKSNDWGIRWTAIHYLISSICFGLASYWLGLGGQFLLLMLGGVPSFIIGHLLGKAKHEAAKEVFESGAMFTMGASFIASMFTCLVCLVTGDPNGDHISGVLSGVFCLLEAVVCIYLTVRWS